MKYIIWKIIGIREQEARSKTEDRRPKAERHHDLQDLHDWHDWQDSKTTRPLD